MSASKKKQQRREAVDTTELTQTQIEQAAYKKKARLYTIIGIVVVVLVAALLIWNSGIFQKNATAATVGDEKLSVAELSYYYYDVRQMYAMYGMIDSSMDDDSTVFNTSDGSTYQDFFLESALTDAQSVYAMYSEAIKAGYSDADVKADLAVQVENMKASAATNNYTYKSFLKAVYGRYMSASVFEKMITRELVANQYYSDMMTAKGESYTAADLDAYYAENADKVDTFEYSYLYFKAETVSTTDEDGEELSEDEVTALKEKAMSDALAKAELAEADYNNNGTEISALIEKYEPTNSGDHTSAVGTTAISSVYLDELLELANENTVDTPVVVEYENYGYYVVFFHNRFRDETPAANVRHILISAETTTDAAGKIVAPTEDAWNTALAEAEKILAEYKAGQMTAEAFAALAEKYSSDTGSNTNGGLYENVTEGYFVTEFNDWMFGENQPNPGDTEIIRHEGNATTEQYPYWGYHVAYLDSWGEADWQLNVRNILTNEYRTEWQEGLTEAYPAELANAAQNVGK